MLSGTLVFEARFDFEAETEEELNKISSEFCEKVRALKSGVECSESDMSDIEEDIEEDIE